MPNHEAPRRSLERARVGRPHHRSSLLATLGLALGILAAPALARSATVSWQNPADGLWSVGSNWSGGSAPGPLDDAVITVTGVSSYKVTLDTSPTVNSLTLGAPGGTTTQTLSMSGRTLTVTGSTAIDVHGLLRLMSSSSVTGVVSNSGSIVASGGGNSLPDAYTSVAGSTLRVDAIDVSANPELTITNGFVNHGLIELATTSAGYQPKLAVSNGFLTNASNGTILSTGAAGGPVRILEAQLDNQGAVNVTYLLTLNKPSAQHVNTGSITLSGSGDFTVTQSGTTPNFSNLAGGTFAIPAGRLFLIDGGHFDHNPGTHTGPGTLAIQNCDASDITLSSTSAVFSLRGHTTVNVLTNGGTVLVHGKPNHVTGYISNVGSTLRVDAPQAVNAAPELTITNGFMNRGLIDLTASFYGYQPKLTVSVGILNNSSLGTITSTHGIGGEARLLEAQLFNRGVINVNWPMTLGKADAFHLNLGSINLADGGDFTVNQTGTDPAFSNYPSGLFTIAANRTFLITGGTFNHDPGHHSGAGTLAVSNCVVNGVTLSPTSAKLSLRGGVTVNRLFNGGTVLVHGNPNTVTTYTSIAGSMLRVDAPAAVNATPQLTITNGFVNHGLIDLTASFYGYEPKLTLSSGTLTNAGDGTIASTGTVGGPNRVLAAPLDNHGLIDVQYGFSPQVGPVVNYPDGTVKGGGTLDVSAVTYTDQGITSPGASSGILTIQPNDTRAATTALKVEIAGLLAGTSYDRLRVPGTVAIDGALSITTSYPALLGDSIAIVTAGTRTGTFSIVSGRNIAPGLEWQVSYKADRVDLIAGVPPPDNSPTALNDDTSTREDQYVDIDVKVNDSDIDLDVIHVVAGSFGPPLHGTVGLNLNESVRYTPSQNYYGPDQFTYVITDNRGGQDTATVSVLVTPMNDPPYFVQPNAPDTAVFARGNSKEIEIRIIAADVDLSDQVTLSSTNLPPGASLTPILPTTGNPASSLFEWTPTSAQIGSWYVNFLAVDPSNASALITVQIDVYDNPTPTLVLAFEANPVGQGIDLRWRLAPSSSIGEITVERAENAEGPWTPLLLDLRDDGGTTAATDRTTLPGRSYQYRLTTRYNGETFVIGMVEARFRAITEFALAAVTPTPSRGDANVSYALARESRVRLSLCDVQGREVALLADGIVAAGRHQTRWSGSIDGRPAAAGVYFVRLETAGRRFVQRLVLAR